MSGNTIGNIFRVTTFGESHGSMTGGIIDGCPAGLPVDLEAIALEVGRRKASQALHSTSRREDDDFQLISGLFEGITTGAPIAFLATNRKQNSEEYQALKKMYRPGHGDFTWHSKYQHFDHRGGGRYSARETLARVIAGAIARQLIGREGISVHGWVSGVGSVILDGFGPYSNESVIRSELFCPDPEKEAEMLAAIAEAAASGDTLGGTVTVRVDGLIPGLGEPLFDKAEAVLAHAIMSIPAVKAFEIGDGFDGCRKRGSEYNDLFVTNEDGKVVTNSNHSGGTLGGLTSGNPLLFRVGFKPVSSIRRTQTSISHSGEPGEIDLSSGRHDVCVVPRAVAVVEAMTAITLADLLLRNRSSRLIF
jgi:chorismate synthase